MKMKYRMLLTRQYQQYQIQISKVLLNTVFVGQSIIPYQHESHHVCTLCLYGSFVFVQIIQKIHSHTMGADATEGKDIVININLILVTAEYWHTLENLSAR